MNKPPEMPLLTKVKLLAAKEYALSDVGYLLHATPAIEAQRDVDYQWHLKQVAEIFRARDELDTDYAYGEITKSQYLSGIEEIKSKYSGGE